MKRNADTGKNEHRRRCSTTHSRRLQEKEEKKKKIVEEAMITEVSGNLTKENFKALYSTKKSIIVACPEDRLPKNYDRGYFVVLYDMVKKFIALLDENKDFSKLEKLTFQDVPVTGRMLHQLFRVNCLPSLRSITIKRNRAQICLFDAFVFEGRRFKLPDNSVLETISLEPGINESNEDDLMALNYFVNDNSRIKSIKVLNTEKHVNQLSTDSRKKAFMQRTLDILSKRHWDKYKAKHAQLDSVKVKDCQKLYLKLTARLWSHTVAKLASSPGIFDKVYHGIVYNHINSGGIARVKNGLKEPTME
jgi:hypothetical protein